MDAYLKRYLLQEHRQQQIEKSGKITFASGLGLIATFLVSQYLSVSVFLSAGDSITLSEEQLNTFAEYAPVTFTFVTVALTMSLVGFYFVIRSWSETKNDKSSILERTGASISEAIQNHKRLFWMTLGLYLLLFLFASNTILYSTEPLSKKFGVSIPSTYVIGCCGLPGSFPVISAYLLEHLGFLIIPINIILAPFLSLLVAINASVIWQNAQIPKPRQSGRLHSVASYCGVSAGTLAACPTCAGGLVLLILSGTGITLAGSLFTVIAKYQPVFAAASISALTFGLILSKRQRG